MKKLIKRLNKSFSFNKTISIDNISPKIKGFIMPSDYALFLSCCNGGEGFIGDNYLILWKAEELEQFNKEYEVDIYAKGIVLFGSNGGGEGIGFDTRTSPYKIIQIPFIGMDTQYAIIIADNFTQLLHKLEKSNDSLI